MYKFHYAHSHSFRLVTFCAAAVATLLHSQQFIMPSIRISKGVLEGEKKIPKKRTQKMAQMSHRVRFKQKS